MAESFENVRKRAAEAASLGAHDASQQLRMLDPRQRKVLGLFRDRDTITSHDVERLFKLSQRTARDLLSRWSQEGFLTVVDPARKSRKYGLSSLFHHLLR
jgi:Fic family protein